MAAKRTIDWYGFKTLFRLVAIGKPKTPESFDRASTLVEERIVLFQADNFDGAIKQAEEEAQEYCERNQFVNIYGQSGEI